MLHSVVEEQIVVNWKLAARRCPYLEAALGSSPLPTDVLWCWCYIVDPDDPLSMEPKWNHRYLSILVDVTLPPNLILQSPTSAEPSTITITYAQVTLTHQHSFGKFLLDWKGYAKRLFVDLGALYLFCQCGHIFFPFWSRSFPQTGFVLKKRANTAFYLTNSINQPLSAWALTFYI